MNRVLAWLAGAIVVAAWLMLFVPIAAHAQTAQEKAACYPDAVRLCGVKPGDQASVGEIMRVGLCLLWHRAALSPACRAVFAAHGK